MSRCLKRLISILPVVIILNSYPATISNQEFDVGMTISGAKAGTNYLRVELYKEGTIKYFGETFNGKDWYSGSDGLSYFPVDITGSSTEASIKGRLGNPDVNEYPGTGHYKLKVKRYTSSGSPSNDTEDPVNIIINYEIETPKPSPTPSVTATLMPSSEPSYSSVKPSSLLVLTPTSTPQGEILAAKIDVSPIPSASSSPSSPKTINDEKKDEFVPGIFIAGIILVGFSFFMFVAKRVNSYNERNVPISHQDS